MKFVYFLILGLLIAGCSLLIPISTEPKPTYPGFVVSMERSICFSRCPYYQLVIEENGNVAYEGKRFVAIEGRRNVTIEPEQIQELVNAIDEANFFLLENHYSVPAKDLRSVTLSITLNGRSKSIWHYGSLKCDGQLDNAPMELCELERKIDEITNSDQWVKQQ